MKIKTKKTFFLFLFTMLASLLFANEFEPEKLTTETGTDVAMFIKELDFSQDIGFTAVQVNSMLAAKQSIIIKSTKKFTISAWKCVSMVQALDENGEESAYMVTQYSVKENSLKKLNKLIKKNQVTLEKLVNAVKDNDLDSEQHGTTEAPSPETFAKLRTLDVYDIFAKTSDGKEIHLQIYAEDFTDSKDL